MRTIVITGAAALVLVASSCGVSDGGDGGEVTAVASTTILGDITNRVIECGGGETTTLMPTGADPHDYAPSSTDVRDMVKADLVVANGLGLEEGLTSALASAEEDGGNVVEVAALVDPIALVGDEGDGHDGEEAGSLDPHVWLDVSRMATAAERIGVAMTDATGDEAFTTCGEETAEDLRGLDTQVRDILSAVPEERRVLITDHQAFGYFAQAYGFEVAGVVVSGGSTLAAPSSEHLAELMTILEESGVSAIFGNVAANSELLETISEEVGREIEVVQLYVGSLGAEGSDAEDYDSMMITNARLIANALTQ